MTYELLHAGFDTLDVAFSGALPSGALIILEKAREEAQERQEEVLTAIGPGKVEMHILSHGMRGGYAFVVDTGPLGAKWMFKNNADATQWNIFASPRATMLLAYGYYGTRDKLWETLDAMGAKVTGHSINRSDFAMDFQTHGFELHQDQFVAHAHTKVSPHWGKRDGKGDEDQLAAVLRGRRLESVTVGKQPGRQIIVYDKRREAVERQKYFWFDAWERDRDDKELEVWRIEVRAGKNELKENYQLRTFEDFETGIGDVIANALNAVKYLDDRQSDSNITRQALHPLWTEAQAAASKNLCDFQSGLTPDQVKEVERSTAQQTYLSLCIGNAIGYCISHGMTDEEIEDHLATFVAGEIAVRIGSTNIDICAAIRRSRNRLVFLN